VQQFTLKTQTMKIMILNFQKGEPYELTINADASTPPCKAKDEEGNAIFLLDSTLICTCEG
jgi:hypothetical protein